MSVTNAEPIHDEPAQAQPGNHDPSRAPVPLRPLSVILDTDPGLGEPGSDVDDGFAIALALRSPELDVKGLTIVNGNVDAPTGYGVARRLCERLGRTDVPIRLGATRPLTRDMGSVHALSDAVLAGDPTLRRPRSPAAAPPTGEESAAAFLVREAARQPGELVIVAIGPLTNLALALALDPGFASNVREFVVMAGSATGYAQNVTTVGDFTPSWTPRPWIACCAAAPACAWWASTKPPGASSHGPTPRPCGRRATHSTRGSPACSDAWIDFLARAFPNRPEHRTGFFLHDPLAVAAVIDPRVCSWEDAAVEVELQSELARGLVVADRGLALKPRGPANAVVATATDVATFHQMLLDRIVGRVGATSTSA